MNDYRPYRDKTKCKITYRPFGKYIIEERKCEPEVEDDE